VKELLKKKAQAKKYKAKAKKYKARVRKLKVKHKIRFKVIKKNMMKLK
jgi:hypothetical protein